MKELRSCFDGAFSQKQMTAKIFEQFLQKIPS